MTDILSTEYLTDLHMRLGGVDYLLVFYKFKFVTSFIQWFGLCFMLSRCRPQACSFSAASGCFLPWQALKNAGSLKCKSFLQLGETAVYKSWSNPSFRSVLVKCYGWSEHSSKHENHEDTRHTRTEKSRGPRSRVFFLRDSAPHVRQ